MGRTPDYVDVSAATLDRLREISTVLPEVVEEAAWAGIRWRIRTRTFAHVLAMDGPAGVATLLTFRSDGDELEVLRSMGHPFFDVGWGRSAVGMVLDAATDWPEVAELITDSYCLMAPKKLAGLVDRPG